MNATKKLLLFVFLHVVTAALVLTLASATPTYARDTLSEDLRLDKKVTLQLGLVTLEQFAKEISKQTGVSITAGDGRNDWKVKERKTVVLAKDVPARDILRQVKELHHYTLSRYGKEHNPSYQFWQDLKGRQEEEDLRLQAAMEPLNVCLTALDEMASLKDAAGKMTPEELAKLEKEDPYKHFLLTDPKGQAMCGIAAEIPAYVWSSPARWKLLVNSAGPGMQSAIQRYLDAQKAYMEQLRNITDRYGTDIPIYPGQTLEFAQVTETDAIDPELEQELGVYGRIEIDDGLIIPLYKQNSSLREREVAAVKAVRDGVDPQKAAEQVKMPDPLESTPLKGDPILQQTVKIKEGSEEDFAAWLQAVHEKTGLVIIADSYWEQFDSLSGEVSVKDILIKIMNRGKRISKEGSVIIITNKHWYEKRPADIPNSIMNYYTKKAKDAWLDHKDLMQIALSLNDIQISKNLMCRKPFGDYNIYLEGPRQLAGMRFLNYLTNEQKSRMSELAFQTGRGKPVYAEELSTEALAYALQAAGKSMDDIQGKTVTFSSYLEPDLLKLGGFQNIILSLNMIDEQSIVTTSGIGVVVPGYRPPKEKGNDSKKPEERK